MGPRNHITFLMTLSPSRGLSAALQAVNGVTRFRLLKQLKGQFTALWWEGVKGRGGGGGHSSGAMITKSCQGAVYCRGKYFCQLTIRRHPLLLQLSRGCPSLLMPVLPPNSLPQRRQLRGVICKPPSAGSCAPTTKLISFMPSARFQSRALETWEKLIY